MRIHARNSHLFSSVAEKRPHANIDPMSTAESLSVKHAVKEMGRAKTSSSRASTVHTLGRHFLWDLLFFFVQSRPCLLSPTSFPIRQITSYDYLVSIPFAALPVKESDQ